MMCADPLSDIVQLICTVQVLSHPQFQADPISAITHHLTATLPPAPAPETPKPKADPLMRKQQKARKKWEKKLHRGPEQMAEDSA